MASIIFAIGMIFCLFVGVIITFGTLKVNGVKTPMPLFMRLVGACIIVLTLMTGLT